MSFFLDRLEHERMATMNHDSQLDLRSAPHSAALVSRDDSEKSPPEGGASLRPGFRLKNGVLACACPDCGAPMNVRLWLMTADCWRCGTSIDLSLEQEREAQRLLERPKQVAPAPKARKRLTDPKPSPQPASQPHIPLVPSPPANPLASPKPAEKKAEPLIETAEQRAKRLREMVACLASLVFHLLLMILLGLWSFSEKNDSDAPELVLSTSINKDHSEGEEPVETDPHDEAEIETVTSNPVAVTKELREADQIARELRLGPREGAKYLPKLSHVRADLQSKDPYRRMLATRDPRIRSQMVRREGGTTLTEAAVARSLRWIVSHQNEDGSWSLNRFHHAPDCGRRCSNPGNVDSDSGGTALALQTLFAAGQTPDVGIHHEAVSRGLNWLVEHQAPNGDLRSNRRANSGMYVHAQATIAMAEANALVGSPLDDPTRRAIEFLCLAQDRKKRKHNGGWRYRPGQQGDLSVTGWQLMALHTGRAAGFKPPRQTLLLASNFLDSVQTDKEGGLYSYLPGRSPSPAMTAEGLLSRMYLGWDRNDPGLQKGVEYLINHHLPDVRRPNIYYWYYGTQVMHHWGGEPWEIWNREMQAALLAMQEQHGHAAGSWYFRTPHGRQGGRLYVTALATFILEVYYRHGRLFDRIELH